MMTARELRAYYGANWRQFDKAVRKKTRILTDLVVRSVDLVKHPANRRRITF